MSKYNPHHPEFYPVRWITAAKLSLEGMRDGEENWVSVDWARGKAGAMERMKRLRAFRDGIKANPNFNLDFAWMLKNGFDLSFSKRLVHGVWDIQLCWKKVSDKNEMLEILKKENGEDMQNAIDTLERTS